MPQSKPIPQSMMVLDSRSRAYMFGHQTKSAEELEEALADAMADPDLKGALRQTVIERYRIRIAGGSF